jgi:alkylhydroperoxidase family enzyme
MARVPLASVDDPSDQVQALYESVRQANRTVSHLQERLLGQDGAKIPQMWRAVAHSPQFGQWIADGSKLFFTRSGWTTDNPKLRQLLILTVARRWGCEFVFRVHADLASSVGLAQDKIDALHNLERARTSLVFDAQEQLLIAFADDVTATGQAGPGIFRDILARYGAKSTVEISGFVAFYLAVVSLCNVLGVEDD